MNSYTKGIAILWLIIAGFILIAGSGYWFWAGDIKPSLDKNKEALMQKCSDGSFVGEFGKCPEGSPSTSLGTIGDIANWKIYTNEKYGFLVKYPDEYISTESSSAIVIKKNKISFSIFWGGYNSGDMEIPVCMHKITQIDGKPANQSECKFSSNDNLFVEIRFQTPISRYPNFVILYKTTAEDSLQEFDQILSTFRFLK